MLKWLALAPVAIFALLGGFFASGLLRDDPDALPSTFIGQSAPALPVTELPGRRFLEASMLADGEVKLVNFFASWCVPCRAEHPQLELLAESVPVYGVNYKDEPADAVAFLEELGDPYTAIGADATARAGIDWGITGVPETFVIDGAGIVRMRYAGPITRAVATETILPAVEAARRGE